MVLAIFDLLSKVSNYNNAPNGSRVFKCRQIYLWSTLLTIIQKLPQRKTPIKCQCHLDQPYREETSLIPPTAIIWKTPICPQIRFQHEGPDRDIGCVESPTPHSKITNCARINVWKHVSICNLKMIRLCPALSVWIFHFAFERFLSEVFSII